MVDALEPAVEAYSAAADAGKDLVECLRAAVAAAEDGKKQPFPWWPKGRAHYLGERSVGHQDPGATSAELLLRAMLKVLES